MINISIRCSRISIKIYSLLVGMLLILIFTSPFLWMVATSLKSNHELFNAVDLSGLFPRSPRWGNYRTIFNEISYSRYLINSLVVALASSFIETLLAASAAYGLGVMRWKQRSRVYWILSLGWLAPFSMLLVPRFLMFAHAPDYLRPVDFWSCWRAVSLGGVECPLGRLVGLDSFFALIVPGSISLTAAFLLITAMRRIPRQLLETARLDLGSHLVVFRRIVLPLIRPSLIVVAFFAFLSSWQSFTWPLVVTSTLDMQTAPIALRAFQRLHSTQWSLTMAGSVILSLPSLLLLFLANRYVIDRFQLDDLYEQRM